VLVGLVEEAVDGGLKIDDRAEASTLEQPRAPVVSALARAIGEAD